MKPSALLVVAALLCATAASGQTSNDEIAFWETVRDSRNPAELQAYVDAYPKGKFVVLAKARLAALGQKPEAQAAPKPQAAPPVAAAAPIKAGELRVPKPGDTWTYRLSHPRLRGQWGQPARANATHLVKADTVAEGRIVDLVSVDGGAPLSSIHLPGRVLLAQGAAVFSPYLPVLEKVPASGRLGSIDITYCAGHYICIAKGRIAGTETVRVPAGSFLATKVIIDEEWRARAISGQSAAQFNGGRTLTVWYAPEVGRAVKYASRLTVGDVPPIDANFDLELLSFEAK